MKVYRLGGFPEFIFPLEQLGKQSPKIEEKKKRRKKPGLESQERSHSYYTLKKNMEASVLVLNRLLSGRFLRRADSQPDNAELPSAIRLMTSP